MSRLDVFLTEKNYVKSRERAKKLIKSGEVKVNGKVVSKPSAEISDSDSIELLKEDFAYVSRGLLKLSGGLDFFGIDVNGLICADIGASTGGFTQCLLDRGAGYVYAVDVGHGQLDESLVNNLQVKNCEGVNARNLTADYFDRTIDFISVDLSFISLKLVMPALVNVLKNNGEICALIKPQFEVGKKSVGKNGIVKDKGEHIRILNELTDFFISLGLDIKGLTNSSVTGGDGNIEYLVYMKKTGNYSEFMESFNISAFVMKVFSEFSAKE